MPELEPKQKAFCEEYIIDLNGTQAAIRAGYSKKTAKEQGYRLLTKAHVQAYVQELVEERSKRTNITSDMVLTELAKMGFSNMEDYTKLIDGVLTADLGEVTRDQMAAVQEFTVDRRFERDTKDKDKSPDVIERFRFKLADKKGALDLLGRHLKLFTDKVEHSGSIENNIVIRMKSVKAGEKPEEKPE